MIRLCDLHQAKLDAAIAGAHLAHFRKATVEAEILRAIWEEPDSPGPERVEDFEPFAVAGMHLTVIAQQFDLGAYFDARQACPACRLKSIDVVGMAAAGARAHYDRLVGGHA